MQFDSVIFKIINVLCDSTLPLSVLPLEFRVYLIMVMSLISLFSRIYLTLGLVTDVIS